MTHKARSLDGARDVGKETVLDVVPLGAARWEMCHPYDETGAITELLQLLLEHMTPAGASSAGVGQNEKLRGLGIIVATPVSPPKTQAIHDKAGAFAALSQNHETRVVKEVIDTEWGNPPFCEEREIMIPTNQLSAFLHPKPPVAVDAAEKLLFLAVNAHDGDARLSSFLNARSDVAELLVPIRRRIYRGLLDGLLEREVFFTRRATVLIPRLNPFPARAFLICARRKSVQRTSGFMGSPAR